MRDFIQAVYNDLQARYNLDPDNVSGIIETVLAGSIEAYNEACDTDREWLVQEASDAVADTLHEQYGDPAQPIDNRAEFDAQFKEEVAWLRQGYERRDWTKVSNFLNWAELFIDV